MWFSSVLAGKKLGWLKKVLFYSLAKNRERVLSSLIACRKENGKRYLWCYDHFEDWRTAEKDLFFLASLSFRQ